MKKPLFCLDYEKNGRLFKCPRCKNIFHIKGIKPFSEQELEKTMKEIKAQNRVVECFCCDHSVIVCEECAEEATGLCLVAACPCCLKFGRI